MLMLSSILFVVGCVLILCFVLLFHACQKRLALVAGDVREQVDRKTRAAHVVDAKLVQRVCDGKSLSESIDQWQGERAAVLETGRVKDPWRWTADDLRQWMNEQIHALTEAIRRRYLVATLVTSVVALLITGAVCLVYYHYYSAREAGPNLPLVADSSGFNALSRAHAFGSGSPNASVSSTKPGGSAVQLPPPGDISDLLTP